MFDWMCPECTLVYTYNGGHTTQATGKCSNEDCNRYRVSTKVWQYRVSHASPPPKVDSTPLHIQPTKITITKPTYAKLSTIHPIYKKMISGLIANWHGNYQKNIRNHPLGKNAKEWLMYEELLKEMEE